MTLQKKFASPVHKREMPRSASHVQLFLQFFPCIKQNAFQEAIGLSVTSVKFQVLLFIREKAVPPRRFQNSDFFVGIDLCCSHANQIQVAWNKTDC
jgi:hypothetical protein